MYSSPHPLPTPHPCTLAHRINKGNSKNVIGEEEQFLLQQAPLAVLLGTLRAHSRRNALELSPAASSRPPTPLLSRFSGVRLFVTLWTCSLLGSSEIGRAHV